MASGEFCTDHLLSSLSGTSLQHALGVLAEATSTTITLFNMDHVAVVGPVAGSTLLQELLQNPDISASILEAHRATAAGDSQAADDRSAPWGAGWLDRFAIPVIRGGIRAGTLTIGDRPRQPVAPAIIEQMSRLAGGQLAPTIVRCAHELPIWTAAEAQATRNLAAVVVELFANLCMQDEDLHNRIMELSTVYNIAGMFAGSRDVKDVLTRTARMVCEVMKIKSCSIRVLDESTGTLSVKAMHNLSWDYLDKGPVSLEDNPIDQAALKGEMVRILEAPSDPRVRYPEQMRREGIVSGLVCGMIYRGKSVGVIRVYTGEKHVFTPYEESLLQAVASQAAAAMINAQLVAETIEAERYARQIAYAGDVQRRMVPEKPPELKQVDIGALYRPTYQVGGDFYDFIQLPKGNLGVGIADVSGKGVPASLLMASLRSALRVYAYFTYDVDTIMAEVNQHMCRDTRTGEFVTALYGVLTPDGRRFTYCNAGHDPPMLLRDGEISYLEAGGLVLGVDCTAEFERGLLEVRSGDTLLLYTDGAVEALNFTDQQFGRQRLAESLKRHADQPAASIVRSINWDLRRFRGLADRVDDVTLVAMKIR